MIRVLFRHPDPLMAAEAVNLLTERFQERHLWAFGEGRATAFLQEKTAAYRKQLDADDRRIQRFLEEHRNFRPQT